MRSKHATASVFAGGFDVSRPLGRAAVVRAARRTVRGRDQLVVALVPRLHERAQEQLGRLSAGHTVAPGDDEERHAVDAQLARLLLVLANLAGEVVAGEHGAHGLAVETSLAGQA